MYAITANAINAKQQTAWNDFLTSLINAAIKNPGIQLANVTFESDIVKPIGSHFSRFRGLNAQPLIAFLTQNACAE